MKLANPSLPIRGRALHALLQNTPNSHGYNFKLYANILQHCTECRLPRQAKQLHARLILSSISADNFIASKFMAFYSKTNNILYARRVFDEILFKNTFAFNAMLIAYSVHNHLDETLKLFFERLSRKDGCQEFSDVEPDSFTMSCVLKAMSEVAVQRPPRFAWMIHCHLIKNGLCSDVFVGNGLVTYYSKCDDLFSAKRLFDEMPEKDLVSWNAMISGYSQGGFYKECKQMYRVMLGIEKLKPDEVTIVSVLHACAQSADLIFGMEVLDLVRQMQFCGCKPNSVTLSSMLPAIPCVSQLKGGKEIHAYAIKIGSHKNIFVVTAMIDTYAKLGYLNGSQRVFDQTKDRSVILWTAIISAYATHGDANLALRLFDEMLISKTKPDQVTFTAVLAACARGGLVDEAQDIFNSLLPKYEIHPLVNHYACVVVCLSRAGKLSEAKEFIKKMAIEPSAKVWGALLSGASEYGDVELGKFVCDYLFEIEPENSTNYIILANLYSKAGRWDEAEQVREKLKNSGFKKVAGSSWV